MNDNQNIIDQFLSNELKGQALKKFEQQLAEDATFAEEVRLQNALLKAAEIHDRMIWKEKLQKLSQQQPIRKRRLWSPMRIAATIAVIVIAGSVCYFAFFQNTSDKEAEFGNMGDVTKFERYKDTKGLQTYPTIQAAYQDSLYEKTIALIDVALKKDSLNSALYFYKGISLIQTEQITTALQTLEKVNEDQYKWSVIWYQAYAYYFDLQFPEAKVALKKLENAPNPYQQKARRLLKVINKELEEY